MPQRLHAPAVRSIVARPTWKKAFWAVLGVTALVPLTGVADPQTEARYPFDPACPWGRLSNGKGMLHRCISEAEAVQLAAAVKTTPPQGALPEAKPTSKPEPAAEPEPATSEKSAPVSVTLAAIKADDGAMGFGKLAKPMDRYRECIEENGGLTTGKGQVVLTFLVRAEFVRAEGVEVKKFSGVSKKAARCLADVVDRRQTGAPSVPMTGVELTFDIAKAP